MSAFALMSSLLGPLAAILSGLFIAVAFPGVHFPTVSFFYLLPIALVPVFVAVENLTVYGHRTLRYQTERTRPRTSLKAAFLFWLMGFTINSIAFYWTTVPAIFFGQIPRFLAYPLFVLYCALSAVFYPIVFSPYIWSILRAEKRKSPLPLWVVVALTTALELYTPRFFLWTFGSLLHDWQAVSQWASLFGFSGGTAFILISNTLIARAWVAEPKTFSRIFVSTGLTSCFWIFLHVFGSYRIASFSERMERMPRTRIGWVQPNFTFSELSSNPNRPADAQEANLSNVMNMTENLLKKVADKKLDLIVWPESVAPWDLAFNENLLNTVKNFAIENDIPLLVQATEFDERERQAVGLRHTTLYSSSFLLRPDGSRSASYRKWVPIPFGESVPFESHFPALGVFLRKHVGNLSKVGIGTSFQALAYTPNDYVAPQICFDTIEPKLSRLQTLRGKASIIINQANFAWMDRSNAGYEFLELGRFRAIENARSFLLISNTGPSVALDPLGREIVKTSDVMSQQIQIADVPINHEFTFFTMYGNIVLHIALGSVVIWLLFFERRSKYRM